MFSPVLQEHLQIIHNATIHHHPVTSGFNSWSFESAPVASGKHLIPPPDPQPFCLTSHLNLYFSSNSGPLGGHPAFTHTFHAFLLWAHRLLRTSSFHLRLFLPLVSGRVWSPHSTRMLDACPISLPISCTLLL